MNCSHRNRFRVFVLPGCLIALSAIIQSVPAAPFEPPSMDGFSLYSQRDTDGDGDGVKETHITQYHNAAGDSLVSLSSKGRIWAWSLETRDNEASNHNYVIRDSNCDGQFDEVYGLDDKFYLPECLKK